MALPDFTADEKFERDRRANDDRLKSRFEHIFSKYERDFTGVGDEIDLTTGEIVVDNGHVASLQFGLGIGSKAASTFIDSFAHEQAEETPDGSDEDDEDETAAVPDESDEDDVIFEGSFSNLDRDADELSNSSEYTSSGILTDDEDVADILEPATPRAMRGESQVPGSQISAMKNIPGVIRDSILAMKSKHGPFDEASLNRFENAIAGEVARFLAQSQPSNETHHSSRDPKWDYPELPTRKRPRSESPAGLTSRPALSSSAALFTKSPKATAKLWSSSHGERAHKRYRSSSPETEEDGVTEAQAKFMSIVRAHATAHHGYVTPHHGSATQTAKFFDLANIGRRILPKQPGGPTIEEQHKRLKAAEFVSYKANAQPSAPWRRQRRLQWEDDVPGFRDEESQEKPEFRPLAPKAMPPPIHMKLSVPKAQAPSHAGPVSDAVAMRLLQKKHVPQLAEKRYKVAHIIEEEEEKGPRPFYTVEEDALLLKMKHEQQLEWDEIMKKMPGRTQVSLYNRFNYIRRLIAPDIMPQAKTKADLPLISSEEAIAQLTRHGPMSGRVEYLRSLFREDENGKTVLEAADIDNMPIPEYREHLRRHAEKQTGAFKEKEDRLIARLRDREHMFWEEMAEYLPGRTAQEIADRYYDAILGRPMPSTRDRTSLDEVDMESQAMILDQAVDQTAEEGIGVRTVDYEALSYEDHDLERIFEDSDEVAAPQLPLHSAASTLPAPPQETTSISYTADQLALARLVMVPSAATIPRTVPRPSRFSGSGGLNPFTRPATDLMTRNPNLPRLQDRTASPLRLSFSTATLDQSNLSRVRPVPTGLSISQQSVPTRVNVGSADQPSSRHFVHVNTREDEEPAALVMSEPSAQKRTYVSFADRGIDEVPNSTAQTEWSALSQSSNSGSVRLLQQRPLRPGAQRRRSAGDAMLQVKAIAAHKKAVQTSARGDSMARDSSISSKHDSFVESGADVAGRQQHPSSIADGDFGPSLGAVDRGKGRRRTTQDLPDFAFYESESTPEPSPRQPTPSVLTPLPKDQLVNLTQDMYKDYAKHVARSRKGIMWHSSDDESESDYAPERDDVLAFQALKEAAIDRDELEKLAKVTAAAKAMAEREKQELQKASQAKPRRSLPAKLNRLSSKQSSLEAPSSPDMLHDRRQTIPATSHTKPVHTLPRLHGSDTVQAERRQSLPLAAAKPRSSLTTQMQANTTRAISSNGVVTAAMSRPPVVTGAASAGRGQVSSAITSNFPPRSRREISPDVLAILDLSRRAHESVESILRGNRRSTMPVKATRPASSAATADETVSISVSTSTAAKAAQPLDVALPVDSRSTQVLREDQPVGFSNAASTQQSRPSETTQTSSSKHAQVCERTGSAQPSKPTATAPTTASLSASLSKPAVATQSLQPPGSIMNALPARSSGAEKTMSASTTTSITERGLSGPATKPIVHAAERTRPPAARMLTIPKPSPRAADDLSEDELA